MSYDRTTSRSSRTKGEHPDCDQNSEQALVEDLIDMGRWKAGDRDILIVFDAGYDAPRMAYLLEGLPVEVLGRMRTDRVVRKPVPVRGSHRRKADARPSTARSSASPSRTPGASPMPRPRRSPTATARPAPWPGTASILV
ncbi:transposase [Streptomyces sp. NPDC058240]|uniref:transposase n=1 Tax=Streptomyces sp. NPDC058240 TaxID=3346396 RepID=UPI0036DFCC8D